MSAPSSAPQDTPKPAPWHAAFPKPSSSGSLEFISAEELHSLILHEPAPAQRSFTVIDVRRTDFENRCIRGAINLPAHSIYPTLPGLVPLLERSPLLIFHCNSCSSPSSRGRLSAGWVQDALDDAGVSRETCRVKVLEGGIKGWVEKYGEEAEVTVSL
ncbi:hypothetical protein JCM8097_002412 [Rhodosporidiobolus ruineniae]